MLDAVSRSRSSLGRETMVDKLRTRQGGQHIPPARVFKLLYALRLPW